jgi:hypothetical protein
MHKDLIVALLTQALDMVLTDEVMKKGKVEMIKALKDLAAKTETKLDDYAAKKLARFLEV